MTTRTPLDPLRIGFVGVGGMGTNHITNLVRMPGVDHPGGL